MGIIDDYLDGSSVPDITVAPVSTQKTKSGIIDQFLNQPEEPTKLKQINKKLVPASAPINGVVTYIPEDELKNTYYKGGENTGKSVGDVLTEAGKKVGSTAATGIMTAGKGLSDTLSGKPASGLTKIGMGLLGVAASPSEGISSIVTDITGNPNIGERAGFIAGGTLPVGTGVKVLNEMRPSNVALKELVSKITSNGRDPQALLDTINAMKANPRIGPADTSPAVLNMTQKLFTTEGDAAKNYIYNTSTNRVAGSKAAVEGAYNAAGGTPVHVVNKLNDLATASKTVGQQQINPAIAGAGPVNVTNTIDAIDQVLKPGVMSKITGESGLPLSNVKKELANIKGYLSNGQEMRTDAADLHNFQAGLRRTAEGLQRSSDGGQRQLGQALMNVRNNLVNDIDKASGGKYKPALSNYRDEMDIADAFRDGYNGVFINSKKMENRPEFTQQWFNGLSDNEKEAAREGARLAIDTEINVARNGTLAGTNLGKSDFNQQKLAILFGKDKANTLLQNLEQERAIANTHNKIIEGSQTEMRRAGDQAIALPVKGEPSNILSYALPLAGEYATTMMGQPGVGAVLGLGALAAKKAGSATSFAIRTKLAKERNLQLAKMALPIQGPSRDQLIADLEKFIPGPKQSIMTRSANVLGKLIGP